MGRAIVLPLGVLGFRQVGQLGYYMGHLVSMSEQMTVGPMLSLVNSGERERTAQPRHNFMIIWAFVFPVAQFTVCLAMDL